MIEAKLAAAQHVHNILKHFALPSAKERIEDQIEMLSGSRDDKEKAAVYKGALIKIDALLRI